MFLVPKDLLLVVWSSIGLWVVGWVGLWVQSCYSVMGWVGLGQSFGGLGCVEGIGPMDNSGHICTRPYYHRRHHQRYTSLSLIMLDWILHWKVPWKSSCSSITRFIDLLMRKNASRRCDYSLVTGLLRCTQWRYEDCVTAAFQPDNPSHFRHWLRVTEGISIKLFHLFGNESFLKMHVKNWRLFSLKRGAQNHLFLCVNVSTIRKFDRNLETVQDR